MPDLNSRKKCCANSQRDHISSLRVRGASIDNRPQDSDKCQQAGQVRNRQVKDVALLGAQYYEMRLLSRTEW